jgi:hypothetical protein
MTVIALMPRKRRERPVNCVVCRGLFWTPGEPPHVCDACLDAWHDVAMEKLETEARVAGFPSGEAYLEALERVARRKGDAP